MDSKLDLINLEFGTKQLSGNQALYKRLLARFSADYKHTSEKLAEFEQLNNLEEMQLLVHTIKGVSGNLGLDQLHSSASAMDASLKVAHIDQALLNNLHHDLKCTLAEIDSQCNQSSGTSSATLLAYSAAQLTNDLQHQRFITNEKLTAFLESCELSQAKQQVLKDAIDQLDYDLALQTLESD